MPKNFVQQSFYTWFKHNQNRFRHPPTQVRYIRGYVEFFFSDVIHEISAVINKYGCNVAFTYQSEVWDFLICFDVSVERDTEGYFCGQCIVEEGSSIKKRFHSRAALLAEHVFEPLLVWSNERLSKDVFAQINQMKGGGSTWVNLLSTEQIERASIEKSVRVQDTSPPSREDGVCVVRCVID
jgi:hypothetical protein